MRLRRFDGSLLPRALHAVEHRLKLLARRIDVALHRVQCHLRRGTPIRRLFPIPQVLLERCDAFPRGAQFGFCGGDDPGDFRRDRTLGVGVLALQTKRLRMVGPEPALLGLNLCGYLVLERAKLHHARRDRRLGRRAGAAAGGVQLCLGVAQRGTGVHQILGEVADLLRIHPGVHALRQALARAVGGDAVLAVVHVFPQFGGALVQPFGRPIHRAMLRRVLVLDIDVHRVVDRGGGDLRVLVP